MAILSYFTRFTMKRGNAGSWNSGWKRSKHWKPILHCSKNPETPWNIFLELIRIIEQKKYIKGPHPGQEGGGRAHPYWAPPLPRGPPVGPPVPIFCYMKSFVWRKIISKPSGQDSATTRRNLGGINLGLRQSCSAGDTSLREGEIIAIVITNDPLIGRGLIFINIFTNTISSQTLVHLLYPIFVPKPQIGTCGLLIVLITPCSWC